MNNQNLYTDIASPLAGGTRTNTPIEWNEPLPQFIYAVPDDEPDSPVLLAVDDLELIDDGEVVGVYQFVAMRTMNVTRTLQ